MITLNVNGNDVSIDAPDDASLLSVLSEDLQLAGSKYGCGLSQCGSCSVLLDGEPVKSCQTAAKAAVGRQITTIQGLMEDGEPNKLQKAFIEEQAAQCGYCTSGMIIVAQALLDRNPSASEAEVRSALSTNLCRCGSQNRIVKAVLRAAEGA